jgi:hypothetical protein
LLKISIFVPDFPAKFAATVVLKRLFEHVVALDTLWFKPVEGSGPVGTA